MPVYNPSLTELSEAIDSILGQTYRNFEFIIIDDGSNSNIRKILCDYKKSDSRISLFINQKNQGIVQSLNFGLRMANTKWVARMDADDWSCPDRLERQVEFLSRHPEIAVLGTNAVWMDNDKNVYKQSVICSDDVLSTLPFYCCFIHPSVVLNREVVLRCGGYPDVYAAEDYALWAKICFDAKLKTHILPYVGIRYRRPDSSKYHGRQCISSLRVRQYIYEKLTKDSEFKGLKAYSEACDPQGLSLNVGLDKINAIYCALDAYLSSSCDRSLLKENCLRAKKDLVKNLFRDEKIGYIEFIIRYFLYKTLLLVQALRCK